MMLMNRALAELIGGSLDESGPLLEEALRTARQIDDRVGLLYQIGALSCRAAAKRLTAGGRGCLATEKRMSRGSSRRG